MSGSICRVQLGSKLREAVPGSHTLCHVAVHRHLIRLRCRMQREFLLHAGACHIGFTDMLNLATHPWPSSLIRSIFKFAACLRQVPRLHCPRHVELGGPALSVACLPHLFGLFRSQLSFRGVVHPVLNDVRVILVSPRSNVFSQRPALDLELFTLYCALKTLSLFRSIVYYTCLPCLPWSQASE